MRHFYFILLVCLLSFQCKDQEDTIISPILEELTLDNYPHVDGSTSTAPLNAIIACQLLGIDYKWVNDFNNSQRVQPDLGRKNSEKFSERIKSSQTHQSFINLIDKNADLILSARKMSEDEMAYAQAAGVSLIETPIALDAFIFIVHPGNSIKTLTIEQIQDIYTGKITNWSEVGGEDRQINPYVRNPNSGSQELMESLVMKELEMPWFPESYDELMAFTMTGAFEKVDGDVNSICYTVYYYKEHIITSTPVKTIAIDGILADRNTIADRTYSLNAEVYAVIRSDLEKSSMAHLIYEWLQTPAGKATINESGYVPY